MNFKFSRISYATLTSDAHDLCLFQHPLITHIWWRSEQDIIWSIKITTVVKDLFRAATHNTIKMHNFKPCPKQLWFMQTQFETCTLHKKSTHKNNFFTTATY